jgi:4,5-DOPA dioxygenase extradiol
MPESILSTRRHFVRTASAASALLTLSLAAKTALAATGSKAARMPVIFVGHGSPMNAISDNAFTRQLRAWGDELGRPAAILSVSAHWLTRGETLVDAQSQPPTIHDFGGFPKALHEMRYPAPGAPDLARQALGMVAPLRARASDDWGLDHGTWTVLHHLFPRADVPVFQLSIDYDKSADFHYTLGRRLARLRDQGVLIMGSGNVVHNLRATERGAPESARATTPWAQSYDDAIRLALEAKDDKALVAYAQLDAGARMAVPTPDHYWPFLYALGAADPSDTRKTMYASFQAGTLSMRCVQFG